MKVLLFFKSGLVFLLVAFGISFQGSDDTNSVEKMARLQALKVNSLPLGRPAERTDSIIEKGYVLLRTDSTSPVKLINISPTKYHSGFNKGVNVEVLNTSNKTVAFTDLAVSVPPTCLAFYLAGDAIVKQGRNDNRTIRPLGTRSFFIPGDIAKIYFPPEKYIKKCPTGQRKPVIYVWAIEFTDGSKWLSHPD
jgi:hypothetical protein